MSSPAHTGVAVVFLARKAEGEAPLRRFVESYRRYAAGIDHDLCVVYKGFEGGASGARNVLSALPHTGIAVTDAGLDIGAYLTAAHRLPHRYICFLNTFAEVAADGWLQALHRFATLPAVGIAGAMGSFESLRSTLKISHKVRWLCNEMQAGYSETLDGYFEFVTAIACRRWRASGRSAPLPWRSALLEQAKTLGWRWRSSAGIGDFLRPASRNLPLDEEFERRWAVLIGPRGYFADYSKFGTFPNPHIRSNVFMMERRRLLELGYRAPATKMQACFFESAREGVTARLRRQGLGAIVVGKDGRGFDVQDWVRSGTYRLGDQGNLLATDNQTRRMADLPRRSRFTFSRLAWGDYGEELPPDYPHLGILLPRDAGATEGPRALRVPG